MMTSNPPNPMQTRRNEMLADVSAQVERLLVGYDIAPVAANLIGVSVADHLAEFWGSQNFTMPKDYHYIRAKAAVAIFEAWGRGERFDALARQYGLTTRAIRLIIERVRKQRRVG